MIPQFEEIRIEVLKELKCGKIMRTRDLKLLLAKHFHLTQEEMNAWYPSGNGEISSVVRLKKCNGGMVIRSKKCNSCSTQLKNPGLKKNLINPLRIRSRCPTMYPGSHIHNTPQT